MAGGRSRRLQMRVAQSVDKPFPNPALVAKVQAALDQGERYGNPTCAEIIRSVARKHGLTYDDLRSAARFNSLVWPRREAMYRCAVETLSSITAIGNALRRDHSTVIHGVRAYCRAKGLPMPRGLKSAARIGQPGDKAEGS